MLIFYSDLVDGQTVNFSTVDTLVINDPGLSAADLAVSQTSDPDPGIALAAPGKTIYLLDPDLHTSSLMFADGSWLVTGLELHWYGQESIRQGGPGDDQLLGFAGDQTLIGGEGDDILNGGGGWDIAAYADAVSGVTVDLGLIGGQDTGGAGRDTLIEIDGLIGSAFADTLRGDAHDNTLDGLGGDDRIDGGNGRDIASYAQATAYVRVDLGITAPQETGAAGRDTLIGIEELVGSAFDDVLTGNSGDNRLDGGAGADLLIGLAGNDDLLVDAEGDQVQGGAGVDTVWSTAPAYTLGAGVENLVLAPMIQNSLALSNLNGTGNELNNILTGNQADNCLNGAGGVDTASYADSEYWVEVNLALHGPQDTGWGGFDTLIDIENLRGGAWGDRLYGDGNDNRLEGGGGADTLGGGLGDDVLLGGPGRDTASYLNAGTGVQVQLGLAGAQATLGAGLDTLKGVENLQGSGFDDQLQGDDRDNLIEGLAGNDTLSGGDGFDLASYANTAAGVRVRLWERQAQETGGAGLDTLSGFEGIVGSQFDDTLEGDAGANRLDGGYGTDILRGFGGNDAYWPDSSDDIIREQPGGGRDQVILAPGFQADYQLPDGVEDLVMLDWSSTKVVGNALNNRFFDLYGSSRYSGGAGFDTLSYARRGWGCVAQVFYAWSYRGIEAIIGTALDDEFLFGDFSQGRRYDGGAGLDTLKTAWWSDSVRLSLATDRPQPIGATSSVFLGFENLTTGGGNDRLIGNASANSLSGNEGDDLLRGSAGDDRLTGGHGADTLTGGRGADELRFEMVEEGGDIITDFTPGEDCIGVNRAWFGYLPLGTLAPDSLLAAGTAPADADPVFIYDLAAGGLSFDPDGTGFRAAVEIARLTPGTAPTASDILVYS